MDLAGFLNAYSIVQPPVAKKLCSTEVVGSERRTKRVEESKLDQKQAWEESMSIYGGVVGWYLDPTQHDVWKGRTNPIRKSLSPIHPRLVGRLVQSLVGEESVLSVIERDTIKKLVSRKVPVERATSGDPGLMD